MSPPSLTLEPSNRLKELRNKGLTTLKEVMRLFNLASLSTLAQREKNVLASSSLS
jgi:transcriptional regulator with XRE-family HTH domain